MGEVSDAKAAAAAHAEAAAATARADAERLSTAYNREVAAPKSTQADPKVIDRLGGDARTS